MLQKKSVKNGEKYWEIVKGELEKIQKDLKNELYLTYYGVYTVARERSFTVCYIYDGDRRIELRCMEPVKEGSHLGHVVYSKNSLYAVDIY